MQPTTIPVAHSLMRHRFGFSNHYATEVNEVRFTNSSKDELARVIARKFGWTVKSVKASFKLVQ